MLRESVEEPEPDLDPYHDNIETEDDTTLMPEELANAVTQEVSGNGMPEGYEIEEESGIVKAYEPEEVEVEPPISDMALEAFLAEIEENGKRPARK